MWLQTTHVKSVGACGTYWAKKSEVEKNDFKNTQKETIEGMTGVLARNVVRGSFCSHYTARGAGFGLVGEWSTVKNRFVGEVN
jgi:hypothetical protein